MGPVSRDAHLTGSGLGTHCKRKRRLNAAVDDDDDLMDEEAEEGGESESDDNPANRGTPTRTKFGNGPCICTKCT